MERIQFSQKMIGLALLLCLMVFFNAEIVRASGITGKSQRDRGYSAAASDHAGTGFVEERGAKNEAKTKRFPWLPVILALVAGAVVAYVLLNNKDTTEEDGFRDDFSGSASPLWRPRSPSLWSVVSDIYSCFSSSYNFSEYNYVDRIFNSNDLVIEARLRQPTGDIGQSEGVFFVTGTTMTAVSGFEFRISTNMLSQGAFSIVRYDNSNLSSISPASTSVAAYTSNAAIGGDQSWNTLRIVRAGSAYSFYCNGVLLHSFSDASIDPAVAGLRLWSDADPHRLDCDFFSVEI